jgi:hypothetical protein
MMQLLTAFLYMFLVIFFLTRDEDPTVRRPRAVDDDDRWPPTPS